jgi:hypothetical protein
MSDRYKRKHESGHEKRKKREKKNEALKGIKGFILKLMNKDVNNDSAKTPMDSSPSMIQLDQDNSEPCENLFLKQNLILA